MRNLLLDPIEFALILVAGPWLEKDYLEKYRIATCLGRVACWWIVIGLLLARVLQ